MLPGSKLFWHPDWCDYWRLQVKCASSCWELALRNGGIGKERGAERVHRRVESSVLHQDMLSPMGVGAESAGKATAGSLLQSCGEDGRDGAGLGGMEAGKRSAVSPPARCPGCTGL